MTPAFVKDARPSAFTSSMKSNFGHKHTASLQHTSAADTTLASDDDDEIVWCVSSRSSAASTSPVNNDSVDRSSNAPLHDNRKSRKVSNRPVPGQNEGDTAANAFLHDFELVRGDYGSKEWTPPPSVKRQRGHRSTKSESALPTSATLVKQAPVKRELEPVKEAWADDVSGLERQMARASLISTPTRPRSTPGAEASQTPQSPSSGARKQRGQKKQKGGKSSKSTSPMTTNSVPKDSRAAARSYPSPAPSPSSDDARKGKADVAISNASPKKKSKKAKGRNKPKRILALETAPSTAPSSPRGLGIRSVVDDVSEYGDALLPLSPTPYHQAETDRLLGIAYDEAVQFMNAFIENPDYYTSRASRLTFLQALIVELGLVSATGPERALPESLSAAKALLKAHAFLNVKDYLAEREKGLDAIRRAMRPSRSALVRELRGRGGEKARRAKLGWVKETGLTVLLVSCQY